MTSCMTVKENICAYLDNELSPEDRRRFEEHIESCDTCKQELDEMKEIIGLCTSLPQQELPDGFRAELHEKLLAVADRQKSNVTGIDRSKRLRYIKMISSIAAGLLLIFLTGSLVKYGFNKSGNMAQTAQSAEMPAKDAAAQPSEEAEYGGATDNGAAAGATDGAVGAANGAVPESAVSAKAADTIQGIVNFSESAAAPSGSETDRSAAANDRSTAATYAAAAPADETVYNRISAITITTDDPTAITDKITVLALENNGGIKEPAVLKSVRTAPDQLSAGADKGDEASTGTGEGEAATAGGADAETAQPLHYLIPAANYDKFISSVNGTFGAANVQSGALVTEDLTGTLDDKMKRSDEIDVQMQELQNDSAKNTDEINELTKEKEELDGQIETIRLDSDFVTVTVYINKK